MESGVGFVPLIEIGELVELGRHVDNWATVKRVRELHNEKSYFML